MNSGFLEFLFLFIIQGLKPKDKTIIPDFRKPITSFILTKVNKM